MSAKSTKDKAKAGYPFTARQKRSLLGKRLSRKQSRKEQRNIG